MGLHSCKQNTKVYNDNFLCYLCLENYPEYIYYPCGHYGICNKCKNILQKTNRYKNTCSVCKNKGTIKKIYFQGDIEERNNIENYCLHTQYEENNKLKEENEKLKKKNKELLLKNLNYNEMYNKNSINLKNLIEKYNQNIQFINFKRCLFKIQKFKLLNDKNATYKKIKERNVYILNLIKEHKQISLDENELDNYIKNNTYK